MIVVLTLMQVITHIAAARRPNPAARDKRREDTKPKLRPTYCHDCNSHSATAALVQVEFRPQPNPLKGTHTDTMGVPSHSQSLISSTNKAAATTHRIEVTKSHSKEVPMLARTCSAPLAMNHRNASEKSAVHAALTENPMSLSVVIPYWSNDERLT